MMFSIIICLWGLSYFLYPFFKLIIIHTIGIKFFSKYSSLKDAGDWAIITGSSEGIGLAFAKQLAKTGLNIVLIGHEETPLLKAASNIGVRYGVSTRAIVADFTRVDVYQMIEAEIDRLNSIACLVNNVGICYPRFQYYDRADFLDYKFISDLLLCNMNSAACMTKMVLPKMLAQPNGGCAIINISSFSGLVPFPFLSLYAGSKSFLCHFQRSLELEQPSSDKVILQTLAPCYVATSMTRLRGGSMLIPLPEVYAASALKLLGVQNETTGYLPHAFIALIIACLPESFTKYMNLRIIHKRNVQ